jgi:serine/threonine-protein kinase
MSDERSGTAAASVFALAERNQTSAASTHGELVGSSGLVYRPLQKLGEGGMAEILLAYAEGTGGFSKLVVLKVMRRYLEGNDDFRGMFLAEARVSARLNHPNLVQVHEVVDTDIPYMVMEYLEGKPLTKLRGAGAFPREMMLTVISEALIGLHHAHEAVDFDGSPLNIVHRDVSPHNIFVTYDGVVKVLDFGIAKTVSASNSTKTGEIKGKLSYMAPEQLLGEDVDRRADVFAMGAVLWELLLGTSMWAGTEQGILMHRLATGQIPRPSANPPLDPELDAILSRATAGEPADRYQSALEMQQALDAYRRRLPRVCSPRDVGEALAQAFAEDRAAEREHVRLALKDPSIPPPPVSDPIPGSDTEVTPPDTSRAALWWLAAAAIIGLAAFAGSKYLNAPAPAPATDAPSEATPRSARLVFRVSPAQARVEIDGTPRGTGHFEITVPADTSDHRVVVSAPGHASASRLVRFDREQTLDFTLLPEPAATPAPSEPDSSTSASNDTPESGSEASKSGRKSRRAAPAPRRASPTEPKTAAPEPEKTTQTPADCDPPYYFKNGVKTYRSECL